MNKNKIVIGKDKSQQTIKNRLTKELMQNNRGVKRNFADIRQSINLKQKEIKREFMSRYSGMILLLCLINMILQIIILWRIF
tara:strand:+ start:139 stop:384 length:246 start_codon:yes stop_codon:yes gene_type:complete